MSYLLLTVILVLELQDKLVLTARYKMRLRVWMYMAQGLGLRAQSLGYRGPCTTTSRYACMPRNTDW